MSNEKLYRAGATNDYGSPTILGYFKGDKHYIEGYCEAIFNCGYGLILEEIKINTITQQDFIDAQGAKEKLEEAERQFYLAKEKLNKFHS